MMCQAKQDRRELESILLVHVTRIGTTTTNELKSSYVFEAENSEKNFYAQDKEEAGTY